MKIQIWLVGKTRSPEIAALIGEYTKRVNRYLPLDIKVIPDTKKGKNVSVTQHCEQEGKKILEQLRPGDLFYLMDEQGKGYSSRAFARLLQKQMNSGRKKWILAIGGPYGFSQEVYERAHGLIRLSEMTFPHELAGLFLVEQMYRACTILKGEPYHHG